MSDPSADRVCLLQGDELIRDAKNQTTRSVSIDAAPDAIWPWLVQMRLAGDQISRLKRAAEGRPRGHGRLGRLLDLATTFLRDLRVPTAARETGLGTQGAPVQGACSPARHARPAVERGLPGGPGCRDQRPSAAR